MSNSMDRREALQNLATGLFGGAAFVLTGCSSGGGGGRSAPPIVTYSERPDRTHKPLSYYSEMKASSRGKELVRFDDPDSNAFFEVRCTAPDRGGIEFTLLDTRDPYGRAPSVVAHDPKGGYFPKIVDVPRRIHGLQDSSDVIEFGLSRILKGIKYSKHGYLASTAGRPSQFNAPMMDRTPKGLVYVPASFNDFEKGQEWAEWITLALVTVNPNPGTATAYSVATTSGKIIDTLDELIDVINKFSKEKIDKDKKYDFYIPTSHYATNTIFSQTPLVIASSVPRKNVDLDIAELYPLQPGNRWSYAASKNSIPIEVSSGIDTAFGIEFMSVDQFGTKSFLGYKGNTLKYFGFKDDKLNVMFKKPVSIGDDKMFVGRFFDTSSDIVVENHPEVTGTVRTTYEVESRGHTIRTHGNFSFGDCFKITEKTSVTVRNTQTGKTSSNSLDTTRYLAQNMGPIRISSGGSSVDLVNMSPSSESLESRVQNEVRAADIRTPQHMITQTIRNVAV